MIGTTNESYNLELALQTIIGNMTWYIHYACIVYTYALFSIPSIIIGHVNTH